MSKEKQCECCHEWWYDSDVKENLCPNCYDYFKQLKQQLAEKDKEIAHLKEKDNYHLRYELAGADETITNLKQQLEEKDKEINSLIADYEKRISQEQELMSNIEHRLFEKQNTIDEINKEFVQAVHDWKALCAEKDKEIEKLKTKQKPIVMHSKEDYFKRCNFLEEENIKLQFAQTQLAIQELEKVKVSLKDRISMMKNEEHSYLQKVVTWHDICDQINNQIKELKGENYEETRK